MAMETGPEGFETAAGEEEEVKTGRGGRSDSAADSVSGSGSRGWGEACTRRFQCGGRVWLGNQHR